MNVILVVGARPNFMKAAPVMAGLADYEDLQLTLLHTGQHYDERMSGSFFRDLGMPRPDVDLGVGSGSHATQTAEVMTRFERYLVDHPTDLVLVVGDVNSTVACALTAVKLHVPVAHVESGLRSGDRSMPEEINRLLTDRLSSLLFVTEPSGVANLRAEGVPDSRVHFVGNTMIDSLLEFRERALERPLPAGAPERYGVLTLHRPSNVDQPTVLEGIVGALETIATDLPLYWPIHPRCEKNLEAFGLAERVRGSQKILECPPMGYLDFMALVARSSLILTDSGGIQEEALVHRVPVVTLRENTERPVTVDCGGNKLAGSEPEEILAAAREMLERDPTEFKTPELWDGQAGRRIAQIVARELRGGLAL